jgi:hypothetical protein
MLWELSCPQREEIKRGDHPDWLVIFECPKQARLFIPKILNHAANRRSRPAAPLAALGIPQQLEMTANEPIWMHKYVFKSGI